MTFYPFQSPLTTSLHLERAVAPVASSAERRARLARPSERRVVAYHESGHAVVMWRLGMPLGAVVVRPEPLFRLGVQGAALYEQQPEGEEILHLHVPANLAQKFTCEQFFYYF